jgi:hypothetical protein
MYMSWRDTLKVVSWSETATIKDGDSFWKAVGAQVKNTCRNENIHITVESLQNTINDYAAGVAENLRDDGSFEDLFLAALGGIPKLLEDTVVDIVENLRDELG